MKVWNISDERIKHLYNSRLIIIESNSLIDLSDDAAVFLVGKREIRGKGLVQVKDGDSKSQRYAEGRLNMYNWATQIYSDYEKHCEEREGQRLQPLKPHEAIKQAKQIIDDYEKWQEEGSPVREELEEKIGEKKVYACPHCNKEFSEKIAYFGHLRSHQKEQNVDTGTVSDKSEGEG